MVLLNKNLNFIGVFGFVVSSFLSFLFVVKWFLLCWIFDLSFDISVFFLILKIVLLFFYVVRLWVYFLNKFFFSWYNGFISSLLIVFLCLFDLVRVIKKSDIGLCRLFNW